jgi:phage terminase large subunit GpA-like protein
MNINLVSSLLSSALSKIEIDAPEIPYRWADNNFYVVKGTTDVPGPWLSFGYQRGMLGMFCGDAVTRVILKKCKRIGYTKCISIALAKFITEQRRSVGVWHPVESDSRDFVTDEINPLFEVVPVFAEALDADWRNKKDRNNTDAKKKFKGCTAYFRGGNSDRSYRQITLSVAILDELSGFIVGTDGNAEFVERAFGRTETSIQRKLIVGSTLTIKGYDLTEIEYDSTEEKIQRHIKCIKCGGLFPLTWEEFKFEKSEDGEKAVDAYFLCPHCQCEIRYDDYPECDEAGVWKTESGMIYDEENDVFVKNNGTVVDRVYSVGVYVWSAYSYYLTWVDLASTWIRAMASARAGDISLLKTFINEMLGRSFEEKEGVVNSSSITDRLEGYSYKLIPKEIEYLVAGCDVQSGEKARVEILVTGVSDTLKQRWHVLHAVVNGSIADEHTWAGIDEVLFEIYKTEDGRFLPVNVALLDEGNGNDTESVRKYCCARKNLALVKGNQKRIVRPCKGTDKGHIADIKGKVFGDALTKTNVKTHFVNHIAIKDSLFSALRVRKSDQEGYIHFPESVGEDYFEQLTNERRGIVNGKVKYLVRKENVGREILDCWTYSIAADYLYKIYFRTRRT